LSPPQPSLRQRSIPKRLLPIPIQGNRDKSPSQASSPSCSRITSVSPQDWGVRGAFGIYGKTDKTLTGPTDLQLKTLDVKNTALLFSSCQNASPASPGIASPVPPGIVSLFLYFTHRNPKYPISNFFALDQTFPS